MKQIALLALAAASLMAVQPTAGSLVIVAPLNAPPAPPQSAAPGLAPSIAAAILEPAGANADIAGRAQVARAALEELRERQPPPPTAPSLDASVDELKAYVAAQAEQVYGWTGNDWAELEWLVFRESSWNPRADNPFSTAFGLFQFLRSTADIYGQNHPSLNGVVPSVEEQTVHGLRYISDRYGTPSAAAAFHRRNSYY